MDTISQEIIDRIVEQFVPEEPYYVDPENVPEKESLASYACISRRFQYAVERLTFKQIHIKSTELDTLKENFQEKGGLRRLFLKELWLTVILPEYEEKYYGRLEREPDQEANNATLTEAVTLLFEELTRWDSQGGNGRGKASILFDIDAWSPSDDGRRADQLDEFGRLIRGLEYSEDDIRSQRWMRSYLAFESLDSVSEVPCITTFRCREVGRHRQRGGVSGRSFDPSSVAELTRKMPNLETVDWHLRDDEKWTPRVERRQQRRLGTLCNIDESYC